MKNALAFALVPIALLSVAAKGGGCEAPEQPILAGDAGTDAPSSQTPDAAPDALISDCPIPEPTCPAGEVFSVAGCQCVATTPAPDASTPGSGDCPIPTPATSPINVYVTGTPSGSTPADFAIVATGSAGDKPAVSYATTISGSEATLSFTGTGETSETYEIAVEYKGSTVLQAHTGWSVAGCGFLENFDIAAGTHSP